MPRSEFFQFHTAIELRGEAPEVSSNGWHGQLSDNEIKGFFGGNKLPIFVRNM